MSFTFDESVPEFNREFIPSFHPTLERYIEWKELFPGWSYARNVPVPHIMSSEQTRAYSEIQKVDSQMVKIINGELKIVSQS